MAAIYTVFTSPHHAPMPNHLPTLIVTPHGQPNSVLYTYLHTEENRVNYLLTPSPQGDLCVAKLFPPNRSSSASSSSKQHNNVVRCEASRDLRWTIENTGVVSPIYKIVNQDDTPLYQISKPNPNAEFWTMFYFKYAGHQIPPKRIEFGKVAKNPGEKGGGTRISITGKTEDEKQVWQTLGVGNEDCVEWVVCCACLNLLDDQILQAAEKSKPAAAPASTSSPASTARSSPAPAAASTLRAAPPGQPARNGGARSPLGGPGIASTAPSPASNLSQTYRNNPPPMRGGPVGGASSYRGDPRAQQPPPPHVQQRPVMPPSQGSSGRPVMPPSQGSNGRPVMPPQGRPGPGHPPHQPGYGPGPSAGGPPRGGPGGAVLPSQQMAQQQRNGAMGPGGAPMRGPPQAAGRRF